MADLIRLNTSKEFQFISADLINHLRVQDGFLEFYDGFFWKKVGFIKGDKGDKGEKGDSIKGDKGEKGDDAPTIKQIVDVIEPLLPKAIEGIPGKPGKTGKPGKSPSIKEVVQELAEYIPDPIPGEKGLRGPKGLKGEKGKDAPTLLEILEAIILPTPEKGEDGKAPDHEINKNKKAIRFQKPSGKWGEWVNFPTTTIRGGGASGASNFIRWNSTDITTDKTIQKMDLDGNKVDATDGDIDITLPPAWDSTGRTFSFVKIDSSTNKFNLIPVDGELISGQACATVSTPWLTRRVSSDGQRWIIA